MVVRVELKTGGDTSTEPRGVKVFSLVESWARTGGGIWLGRRWR